MRNPLPFARALAGVALVTSTAAAQPILSPSELPAEPVERPPGQPAVAARAAEPPSDDHWLTLGAVSTDGRLGARAELDMLALGHWTLGVAATGYDASLDAADAATARTAATGTVVLALTSRLGGWRLRAQLGAGAALRAGAMATGAARVELTTVPIVEAGLTLSRDLFGGWGLTAGPIVTFTQRDASAMTAGSARSLSLFGGLTRRF